MTAEKYVVQELTKEKEKCDKLKEENNRLRRELSICFARLNFVSNLFTKYKSSNSEREYFDATIWDDQKGFDTLAAIIKDYGDDKDEAEDNE